MMDFSNKTGAAILKDMLDRITMDLNKRETGIVRTSLSPASVEFAEVYEYLSKIQNNSFILTADGESLDNICILRGIIRKSATPAKRIISFNITIPEGSRFSTIDGDKSVIFDTLEDATLNVETGYYEALAECETSGTIGNSYYGDLLPLVNTEGLTYAYLGEIELEGTDTESDISLRTRYLNSLNIKAFGGNIASYRENILIQSGVGAVQVYPHWSGGGTVKCSILNSNYGVATQTLIDSVQNVICPPQTGDNTPSPLGYGLAPIGAIVTITTATELQVDLEFTVSLEQGVTVESIRQQVEEAYEEYLFSVRQSWGNALETNEIKYPVNVYIARITAKLLEITGILNVTNVTLNGLNADIACEESNTLQELPVKGTVIINE